MTLNEKILVLRKLVATYEPGLRAAFSMLDPAGELEITIETRGENKPVVVITFLDSILLPAEEEFLITPFCQDINRRYHRAVEGLDKFCLN